MNMSQIRASGNDFSVNAFEGDAVATSDSEFAVLVAAALTISRALVAISARSLAVLGEDVSLPEYRALVLLARFGELRVVDIAGLLAVSPSTASRMCDRLLRRSLITRQVEEADRRAVRLALAPGGEVIVREVTRLRKLEIEAIVARIPPSERPGLLRGLQSFAASAGELGDEDWALPVLT